MRSSVGRRFADTVPQLHLNGGQDIPLIDDPPPFGRIVTVAIGVDRTMNPALPVLQYCASDALKFTGAICAIVPKENCQSIVVTDEGASRQRVQSVLGTFSEYRGEDTLAVFYFAGKSVLDSNGEYSLILGDVSSDLSAELLAVNEIKSSMYRAGNKANLIVLDTCDPNWTSPSFVDTGM